MDVLSGEQVGRVVVELRARAAGGRWAARRDALGCLLGLHGLRVSEVTGIVTEDVDWDRRRVWVRSAKGGVDRHVPLDPETAELLGVWCLDVSAGFALPSRSGRRLDDRWLRRRWADWCRDWVGWSVRFHDLRHTCALQVYRGTGHDVVAVQRLLGHRRLSSTQGYLGQLLASDVRRFLPTAVV